MFGWDERNFILQLINMNIFPFQQIVKRLDELIDIGNQQLDDSRIYYRDSLHEQREANAKLDQLITLLSPPPPPKPVKMELKFGAPYDTVNDSNQSTQSTEQIE